MIKTTFLLAVITKLLLSLFHKRQIKNFYPQIEESIKGFNGDIGIYVKNLRTGKIIAINADTIFPTASIVKVPILVGSDG